MAFFFPKQQQSTVTTLASYNRRQNELRHFAQNWAFLRFMDFKRRKYSFPPPSPYSFPPPSPPCNVVPLFQLPIENNKHPNFEWRGQGRGADSFVLRCYPIYVQYLNNFVSDCRFFQAIVGQRPIQTVRCLLTTIVRD